MEHSRVPQGTCGLKFAHLIDNKVYKMSGPARDLWIEMDITKAPEEMFSSGPARDLWIEMRLY